MRKWIFIVLFAAVGLGVAAFAVPKLFGPKRGSAEWHKKEYLKAMNRAFAESLWDRLTGAVEGWTGVPVAQALTNDDRHCAAFNTHLKFLTETGFLVVTRRPVVSDDVGLVLEKAVKEARTRIPEERGRYTYIQREDFQEPNGAVVTGFFIVSRPQDAALWGELINKADVLAPRN